MVWGTKGKIKTTNIADIRVWKSNPQCSATGWW